MLHFSLHISCPMSTRQVHELASRLQQQHGLPQMRCSYTNKKGFYFVLGGAGAGGGRGGRGGRGGGRQKHPRDLEEEGDAEYSQLPQQSVQPSASTAGGAAASAWGAAAGRGGRGGGSSQQQQLRIPPGFSVLQHNGRTAHVTTCELNALNARLRDASNDCLVLTEQVGQQTSCVGHGMLGSRWAEKSRRSTPVVLGTAWCETRVLAAAAALSMCLPASCAALLRCWMACARRSWRPTCRCCTAWWTIWCGPVGLLS